MGKIKNFVATIAVAAIATSSLTLAVSAAMTEPASTNDHTLVGKYWRITETFDSIKEFQGSYSDSDYANFFVNGTSVSLKGKKKAYLKNYKFVMVTLRSSTDSSRKSNSGTEETLYSGSASVPSGTITSATYNGNLYDSSDEGGVLKEGYIVNVTI